MLRVISPGIYTRGAPLVDTAVVLERSPRRASDRGQFAPPFIQDWPLGGQRAMQRW